MHSEDDLLPLSGLQHLEFCERQWALIHIERAWEENALTAEGRILHERVHEADIESRPGTIVFRGVVLRSLQLGVAGQADVVEFHSAEGEQAGTELPKRAGLWLPFPVEYKRGRPKSGDCDRVQLCAQAMCLEEMLQIPIDTGALYYGSPRRRKQVEFDTVLRSRTEMLAARMHELFAAGRTPAAEYGRKCEKCSLARICMPRASEKPIDAYFRKSVAGNSA